MIRVTLNANDEVENIEQKNYNIVDGNVNYVDTQITAKEVRIIEVPVPPDWQTIEW